MKGAGAGYGAAAGAGPAGPKAGQMGCHNIGIGAGAGAGPGIGAGAGPTLGMVMLAPGKWANLQGYFRKMEPKFTITFSSADAVPASMVIVRPNKKPALFATGRTIDPGATNDMRVVTASAKGFTAKIDINGVNAGAGAGPGIGPHIGGKSGIYGVVLIIRSGVMIGSGVGGIPAVVVTISGGGVMP